MLFTILTWFVFGLIVGLIAKALHPGQDPAGCIVTVVIGVAGSFVGGAINWMLGLGHGPFEASGFLMSILGALLCLAVWRWWSLKNSPDGPRHFLTGKRLR